MTAESRKEARLWNALRDVEDPELPVSVVDLGLIVDLRATGKDVDIKITFTSMGCPGMEMIIEDIQERLLREADVEGVRVKIVWDPIWTKARLSADGRASLREAGISV